MPAQSRQMSLVYSGLENKLKDSHIVMDTSSACRRQLGRLEDQSCRPSHRVSFPCCCGSECDRRCAWTSFEIGHGHSGLGGAFHDGSSGLRPPSRVGPADWFSTS